jgi:hypothetical protein
MITLYLVINKIFPFSRTLHLIVKSEFQSYVNIKITAFYVVVPNFAVEGVAWSAQRIPILALTSPTSGGRSVGIVRLRTKGHGVFF